MSAEALREVWLFSELGDDQLESISTFTFNKSFDPGERIVVEGQTGNGLYVIVSGNVEVLKGDLGGNPQVLAKRGPGDVFGEMALLGEWPRTASVRALDTVQYPGNRPVGLSIPTGTASPGDHQEASDTGPTVAGQRRQIRGVNLDQNSASTGFSWPLAPIWPVVRHTGPDCS